MKTRLCPRCEKRKRLMFFQRRPDGRPQCYCKPCQREYDGERRARKRRELIENPPRPRYVLPGGVGWLCPAILIPRGIARNIPTKFPDVEEGVIPTL